MSDHSDSHSEIRNESKTEVTESTESTESKTDINPTSDSTIITIPSVTVYSENMHSGTIHSETEGQQALPITTQNNTVDIDIEHIEHTEHIDIHSLEDQEYLEERKIAMNEEAEMDEHGIHSSMHDFIVPDGEFHEDDETVQMPIPTTVTDEERQETEEYLASARERDEERGTTGQTRFWEAIRRAEERG